jgi:predicted GNAT family N-acyltransferase
MQTFLSIPQNLIHGTIKDDSRYRHFSSFSVIALSENKLSLNLARKMELSKAQIIDIKIFGVVLHVEITDYDDEKNRLVVYVEFTDRLRWKISRILLQNTQFTPKELSALGLGCRKIKGYLDYGFVQTEEEYQHVLMLRRETYSEVNKMEKDRPLDKLRYFFDDYSDILIVRHGDRIIGSAAMIYGDGKDKPFEVQQLMKSEHSSFESDELEFNDSMIEVAALCVLKDYRKTDVVHGIYENLCYQMMKYKKEYIIVSSDKTLIKTYKSIGFFDTGKTFTQPKYNDLHMHVLIGNKSAVLKAKNVKFLHWWPIWGEIVSHMKETSIIKISRIDRINLYVREIAYKIIKALSL